MDSVHRYESELFWSRVKALSKLRYNGWVGLADASGVSVRLLRKACSNRACPRGDMVARIADALGVSAISLFREAEPEDMSKGVKDSIIESILRLDDSSPLLDILQQILSLPLAGPKVPALLAGDDQQGIPSVGA